MRFASPPMDGLAIGLSSLCVVHCLALPVLLTLVPALGASVLADEMFHLWMLAAVLPTSLLALVLGCRRHRHWRVMAIGLLGITSLLIAVATEGWFTGSELVFTLAGSLLICVGHWLNHRLCKVARPSSCACQ